jgi:hypothetical protein
MSVPKDTLDTSVNGPEDPPGVFDAEAWQQVDARGSGTAAAAQDLQVS